MIREIDRHKSKRDYKSGATKRKIAEERQKKEDEVLRKVRRMSEFVFSTKQASSSANLRISEENSLDQRNENSFESNLLSPDTQNGNARSTSTSEENSLDLTSNSTLECENKKIDKKVQNEIDQGTSYDIGVWPVIMKDNIQYWVRNYSENIQYFADSQQLNEKSEKQQDGKKIRKCNSNFFQRTTRSGEKIHRSWLCFSPKTGRVYCFFCKLLDESKESPFANDGYCDWKHANERLVVHKTSAVHLKSLIKFNDLKKLSGRIDSELAKEIENSVVYWRKVLKRVIDVVTFLSERELAFRGNSETLGSADNGNFLGIIELLSKYDPFLTEHIQKYGHCGRGNVNYLSSTIYEEIIEEIGIAVHEEIMRRLKRAKIYLISVDGIKDRGHHDQLTIVLRYVENDKPVERFIKFLQNQGHNAQNIFEGVMDFLSGTDIDIADCRGQSYDNASPMSGKLKGLQALIKQKNDLAVWVPCFGHSLNLTGEKASSASPYSTDYFMFLQGLYVFLSASDRRWSLLLDTLKTNKTSGERVIVPKRAECTRWSCRAEANRAFVKNYALILEVLLLISQNDEYESKTQCEAEGLYNKMTTLETGIIASFWNDVLENLNNTSKTIQSPKVLLNTALKCVRSLREFVVNKRDLFSHYEDLGKKLTNVTEYKNDRVRRRNVRLNPLDYCKSPDAVFTLSEKFRVMEFVPLIDSFITALDERISSYELIESRFGFLSRFHELTASEISLNAQNLLSTYNSDLDDSLEMELQLFQQFSAQQLQFEPMSEVCREQAMYSLIFEQGVKESFPNTEMVLRTYLTLMISNCTGERSFSKLKLINDPSRVSMTQERLNYLSLISMERDIMRDLDVNNIIKRFDEKKVRKCFIPI